MNYNGPFASVYPAYFPLHIPWTPATAAGRLPGPGPSASTSTSTDSLTSMPFVRLPADKDTLDPRRQPGQRRQRQRRPERRRLQLVWPKDKPSASRLGRLGDILASRGPGMYVQREGDRRLGKCEWSGWAERGVCLADSGCCEEEMQGVGGSFGGSGGNGRCSGQSSCACSSSLSSAWPVGGGWPTDGGERRGLRGGRVYDFEKRRYVPMDRVKMWLFDDMSECGMPGGDCWTACHQGDRCGCGFDADDSGY